MSVLYFTSGYNPTHIHIPSLVRITSSVSARSALANEQFKILNLLENRTFGPFMVAVQTCQYLDIIEG